jgi:hypothetical protein
MIKRHPILITGAHRSGTTWVGKIITGVPSIHYVHEPFNIDYKPNKIKPEYWFQYITRQNEGMLYEYIKKMVTPQTAPASGEGVRQMLGFFNPLRQRRRVLIKDPIAIFSAEWMASRFNMDVVILIRHPAAFADSISERNWTHDFTHFLRQPLLMEVHLSPFKEEIIEFTKRKYDIIDQAILLWKLIYYMVAKYRKNHKEWLFIRHEDLSLAPLKGFKEIFRYLNIKFTGEIKKTIEDLSNNRNPIDGDVHSIKRNSRAIINKWKSKFTNEEIKKIRESVEHISKEFYSEEEW